MNPSLCFNEFTFSPIIRANQPWFKSSEIARALGYKREDFLSKLYRKNADEFTSDMTQVIENIAERRNGVLGNLSDGRCRIFSLRGCHLLAMFARTPVAKAFRKWVLDVIEKYGDRVPVEQYAFIPTLSTPADRKPIAKRKAKALPPAPYLDETPFLEFIQEIQTAHEEVRSILQPLMSKSFELSLSLGLALEKRAGIESCSTKGMNPSENLIGLLQHSTFFDLRQALISPEKHLSDYANPGYSLLGIVRQLNAR